MLANHLRPPFVLGMCRDACRPTGVATGGPQDAPGRWDRFDRAALSLARLNTSLDGIIDRTTSSVSDDVIVGMREPADDRTRSERIFRKTSSADSGAAPRDATICLPSPRKASLLSVVQSNGSATSTNEFTGATTGARP